MILHTLYYINIKKIIILAYQLNLSRDQLLQNLFNQISKKTIIQIFKITMICCLITTSLIIYVLFAYLAYSQVKKILKKYKNHPHLNDVPQQWQGFIRKDKHKWNQDQLIKGCFLKFPFKFFLFLQYIIVCFIIIIIALPFGSSTINKFLRYYARFYGTYIFKSLYTISQPQNFNSKIIKTPIIISNHVCWFDTMYLIVTFYPTSFLAKAQVGRIPIIKTIVNNVQSIYIQRQNQNSRNTIIDKIKQRVQKFMQKAQNNQYEQIYPLIIFPQGTTSNGNAILKFKLGAFNDLAPLTLVSLKYKCDNFDVGMVQISQLQHLILSFCLSVKLQVSCKEITALNSQKPEEYCTRAQLELSKMTGFRIYNSGFRERVQHQKMIEDIKKQQKSKNQ